MDEIEKQVEGKIEADADFQATLTDLTDEEKITVIASKKSELIGAEFKLLREKADRATKAEELANNYKTRAEKAEQAAKEKEPKDGLETKDVLYLAKTDIHDDDMPELLDYSKKMGVSVQKAHEFMKPILAVRAEERRTAAATQTRGGPRGASKSVPAEVLAEAERGAEVEGTDENMRAIFKARQDRRFKNRPGKS